MITNIRLQNFRSYTDASFEFEEGVNVIVGPNASGKTNLLEAILVIAQGKSYRAKDSELIKHGASWGRLDASIGAKERVVKLETTTAFKKTFVIDEKPLSRLSGGKQLPVILFEPNHLLMLGGSPELKRNFLDLLIEQTNHEYGQVVNKYKRTLLQRNRLLKTAGQQIPNQLFAWDIRLSELGEQIVVARHTMIAHINKDISHTYSQLAGKTNHVELSYSNPTQPEHYGSHLLKRLERDRQLDLLRGFTGAGPHREDIIFSLNQQPISQTASRGENRTTLLSLKMVELQIVEAATKQKPLLLLDDVFSELDGVRRKALTKVIKPYQTFITTTDADVVKHQFSQGVNTIVFTDENQKG